MAMEEVPNSGFHGAQSAQDQLPWQRESHTHEGIGSDPKSLLKNAFLKISSLGDTFASSSKKQQLVGSRNITQSYFFMVFTLAFAALRSLAAGTFRVPGQWLQWAMENQDLA